MRRFVPEMCSVEGESRGKSGPKFDVFCTQIFGGRPPNFCGAFVNRHHFRPTGQVWLRSHGWAFIYADEIKNNNKLQR